MRAGDGASCTGSVTGSPSTRCHPPWVDRPAGLPGAAWRRWVAWPALPI